MQTPESHWAAVSRATQIQAHYRAELRRGRSQDRRARLRLRAAKWLVRAGLRIVEPHAIDRLTVERLLSAPR